MMEESMRYGPAVDAGQVKNTLRQMMERNRSARSSGHPALSLCIWGRHGIGKTAVVEAFAKTENIDFVYLAPAQFEEMGDLLGMPMIKNGQSVFAPPAWVPTNAGPGILLLDDFNRADDRILRGLMQLLQRHALGGWALPADWHIVCTANPDNGDYSVTPLDDAILSRMLHLNLEFELGNWIGWAQQQAIDERGIRFVAMNPDGVLGQRTSPRTLVQLFESIRMWEDWKKRRADVQRWALSFLDTDTVVRLMNFIDEAHDLLPDADAILTATDFELEVIKPIRQLIDNGQPPVVLLRSMNALLLARLQRAKPDAQLLDRLREYLLMSYWTDDLRLSFTRQLLAAAPRLGKTLLTDKHLADKLL